MAMAMATGVWDFPTDVLVEILLRLPPSSLRRSRLVCRLWRDAIDDRTTEMQSRAKALLWNSHTCIAYVVDDLSPSSTGTCRELWRRDAPDGRDLQLVGTCNGLLCLCDNEEIGGVITLVNPATGETLPVPPLPCAGRFTGLRHQNLWHRAYSFAYHPTSGRYKVVHVPCSFGPVCELNDVRVITLGETAWREVPVGSEKGAGCLRSAGVISIDGETHWVTEGAAAAAAARVVSFDLEDERITSVTELPRRPVAHDFYHLTLTEVHGRLGIVIRDLSGTTDVWVMEEGRRWSHRYSLRWHRLPRPHFAYGEHVLTRNQATSVYGHYRPKGSVLPGDVVRVSHQDDGTLVAKLQHSCYLDRQYFTFTYVKTTEPLSVYMGN